MSGTKNSQSICKLLICLSHFLPNYSLLIPTYRLLLISGVYLFHNFNFPFAGFALHPRHVDCITTFEGGKVSFQTFSLAPPNSKIIVTIVCICYICFLLRFLSYSLRIYSDSSTKSKRVAPSRGHYLDSVYTQKQVDAESYGVYLSSHARVCVFVLKQGALYVTTYGCVRPRSRHDTGHECRQFIIRTVGKRLLYWREFPCNRHRARLITRGGLTQ